MTERRDLRPHNRARRRLKDFVDRWGDVITLLFAALIVGLAGAVFVIALSIRSSSIQDQKNSAAARTTSRTSCQRTRTFGPPLADAYERFHILTPDQLEKYRETIPARCD
jgi:hypothetical protein